MSTLPEGTIFAGRYQIVRCIAAGGMGAVYEAVHLETERRRALKVMHPHLFQSEEMRERFKREARIAAQVESEYIVDVSDAGVDEATQMPFMVMELLRGEELGARLTRLTRLPPGEVLTCLQQTAMALDRTHAKAIVHRDLKPENLFVTQREDGALRIKILDFGVAKLVAEGATSAGATRSLGTPLYMAPEQFRTGMRLTPAADIHALGMMAFTLLVGQPYWAPEAAASGDVIAFAMTVVRGPQESPTTRAATRGVTLPPGFDAWFARVTAVNPADRFQKASDAVRSLSDIFGAAWTQSAPSLPAFAGQSGNAFPSVPPPAFGSPGASFTPGSLAISGGNMTPTRATSSTGAAITTSTSEAPRNRGLVMALGGVALLAVLAGGVWLGVTLLGGRSPAPAVSTSADSTGTAASSATAKPTVEPVAAVPSGDPSAVVTPSTTADPEVPATASPAKPALTGALKPAAKPTTTAVAKPATTPATKPTTPTAKPTKPLLGRD